MSHYIFSFLLFVMFVMFGCYIKEKTNKQTNKEMGKGVNCEKEMREKNEMGEGGCVCGVGEEKRKAGGYMSGGEKENDIKKKKVMGSGEWGLRVWWEKNGSGKEKKNLKGKKLNWFYLYVHFVWCKI